MKKIFTMFFALLFAASLFAQPCDPATDPDCKVLKVELTYFTGQSVKGGVQLNWQTASEQNANYFIIERSVNGSDFSRIGTVKANNKPTTYGYDDKYPLSIGAYYRLIEVDLNEKKEVFRSIFVEQLEKRLTIFPNPTLSTIHIVSEHVVDIYDSFGRLYRSEKSGNVTISDLPKGVYIVRSGSELQRVIVQ